ncbi:ABC transporter permease [Paenibacillus sp. HB172176]|uniref:ABC transporter permease n=1 Tax=Paenibacillus sp. HB172176 TaxID=2493690 RepID=UPI00143C906F|nr:ABC transporter permease [Paenibacillus sp. HB172176]
MQILRIAKKEIMINLRDMRTFVFMLAFPIVLMLILGTALTNAFTSEFELSDMKLLYSNTAETASLQQYWTNFSAAMEEQGIVMSKAEPGVDYEAAVSEGDYTAYAEISDEGIAFYGSPIETIESSVLQGMLTSFSGKYSLAAAALKISPEAAEAIVSSANTPDDFIAETTVNSDKKPDSIDYYAIAMSTMIAFYSAISASNLIRGERTRNTSVRLQAAPITKGQIFIGKVLGCTAINFICIVAVVLFSKFVFKADWGNHYLSIFLILLTEVLLAVSVGLGLSYLAKNDGGRAFVMIFTQVASFLGGAYFPVDESASFTRMLSNISPLRWANQGITGIIYGDQFQSALKAISLNLIVAAAFLGIAVYFMRKREAL